MATSIRVVLRRLIHSLWNRMTADMPLINPFIVGTWVRGGKITFAKHMSPGMVRIEGKNLTLTVKIPQSRTYEGGVHYLADIAGTVEQGVIPFGDSWTIRGAKAVIFTLQKVKKSP